MKKKASILLSGFLIMLLFVANGCVYMRLLKFKEQLHDFDRYVQIEENGDLLIFRNPIILPKDIRWLMKAEPTIEFQNNNSRCWQYIFKKNYADNLREEDKKDENSDLTLTMVFIGGKLQKIRVPKQFSSELLPAILRSVGDSQIDKADRNLSAQFERNDTLQVVHPPTMQHLEKILGYPLIIQEYHPNTTLSYQYTLQPNVAEIQGIPPVQMTFLFHYTPEQLVKAEVKFHDISVSVAFEDTL